MPGHRFNGGIGEPSTITISGAVGNAIFDAFGVRMRSTPFQGCPGPGRSERGEDRLRGPTKRVSGASRFGGPLPKLPSSPTRATGSRPTPYSLMGEASGRTPSRRLSLPRTSATVSRELAPKRGNLSVPASGFVGRDDSLRQALELIPKTYLLTLVGPGGIGKTRLAIELGLRVAQSFAGGVWLVDLASLQEEAVVVDAIANTIQARAYQGRPENAVAKRLNAAPTLLVLDNCEHLIAPVTALVALLLSDCPNLRVLVTSREPLGMSGEVTLRIGPLALPSETDGLTVQEALQYSAIRLFLDRATAADPTFHLTAANVADVADICTRLDGLALGLEIAAVHIRSVALKDLAERLDKQLSLNNYAVRSSSPRQASLGAALNLTYRSLSGKERRLWRRLAVFRGGFGLEAVRDVCTDSHLAEEEIFRTLAQLVEKSAVLPAEGGRYRLLEPIRQYAHECLQEANEERRLARRHFRWCVGLVTSSEPWWHGRDQLAWLYRVTSEERNIQAALSASANGLVGIEDGIELLFMSWLVWVVHQSYAWTSYYAVRFATALRLTRGARTQSLLMAGVSAWGLGEWHEATTLLKRCVVLSRGSESHALEHGYAAAALAVIELTTDPAARELGDLRNAVALLESGGAKALSPMFTAHLIRFERFNSSISEASLRRQIDLAEAVLDGCEDLWSRSNLQSELGRLRCLLGELEVGEQALREAVGIQLTIDNKLGLARSCEALALLAMERSQAEDACALLAITDRLWDELHASAFLRETPDRLAYEAQLRDIVPRATRASIARALANVPLSSLFAGLDVQTEIELDEILRPVRVTSREVAVAELVASGAGNKVIAARLGISLNTVKTHIAHIMRKLELSSRAEVAVWYAEHSRGPE
jgi:predicted ATPase/DNA-binding NarL/FixJ family response regulator